MGGTYGSHLHLPGDAILPGEAEDVWQVEGEVDDAAAGRRQVGLVEEDTHQEALHVGRQGEGQQKQEEDDGVAVVQNFASLRERKKEGFKIIVFHRVTKVLLAQSGFW